MIVKIGGQTMVEGETGRECVMPLSVGDKVLSKSETEKFNKDVNEYLERLKKKGSD